MCKGIKKEENIVMSFKLVFFLIRNRARVGRFFRKKRNIWNLNVPTWPSERKRHWGWWDCTGITGCIIKICAESPRPSTCLGMVGSCMKRLCFCCIFDCYSDPSSTPRRTSMRRSRVCRACTWTPCSRDLRSIWVSWSSSSNGLPRLYTCLIL